MEKHFFSVRCAPLFAWGFLIFCVSCGVHKAHEDSLGVTMTADTTQGYVGDGFSFQVWVQGAQDKLIYFPEWKIQNENVEIKGRKNLKGEHQGNLGVEFEIAFWDTGSYTPPPYEIHVMSKKGDSVQYSLTAEAPSIYIRSIIQDPNPQLREIKPPVPIPWLIPWKTVLSILGILFMLGMLIWAWKKRISLNSFEKNIDFPRKSPYEIAREKLKNLEGWTLSSSVDVELFYNELSNIVRGYVEDQYFVRSKEMTTEELEIYLLQFLLKGYLKKTQEAGQILDKMIKILKRSDLAKFARFRPEVDQCLMDLRIVESFIETSRIPWEVSSGKVSWRREYD